MTKLNQTDPDKLISMLRGEVGEIIQSWIVLTIFRYKAFELTTEDIGKDLENEDLTLYNIIRSRFRDDIVLRLSDLSSSKHGRLNFHFAADKLGVYKAEVKAYAAMLDKIYVVYRRNKNIAHKQISPRWDNIDPQPHIPYRKLVRAIGTTVYLMKNFDYEHSGEESIAFWKEERKRRYDLMSPASALYLMLPDIRRKP